MFSTQCNENYLYRVYGLNVKSEIVLSELMTLGENSSKEYDVEICLGIVPKSINNPKVKFENYQISADEMFFHIDKIAKYYISNGIKIIVEPDEKAALDDVKTFLLGSAFGALLIQKNMVAIHGGAVVVNGKAVIITGDMGAGKSTLTSAFRLKGYSFLADDVSVICNQKGGFVEVNPGYPQQKLCGDAMLKFGYNSEEFKKINSDRNKFVLPVHNDFIKKPIPIGAIIELKIGKVDKVEIVEIKGSEKLKIIYKNIYREEFISDVGLRPAYYKNFINLVKSVQLYRIIRPINIFSVDEQIDLIVKRLYGKRIVV